MRSKGSRGARFVALVDRNAAATVRKKNFAALKKSAGKGVPAVEFFSLDLQKDVPFPPTIPRSFFRADDGEFSVEIKTLRGRETGFLQPKDFLRDGAFTVEFFPFPPTREFGLGKPRRADLRRPSEINLSLRFRVLRAELA